MDNVGWVCPRCGRVNAPWMMTCRCSVKPRPHRPERKQKICAECEHLDKTVVYASLPPQYKCRLTGATHFIMDKCNAKDGTNDTGQGNQSQKGTSETISRE